MSKIGLFAALVLLLSLSFAAPAAAQSTAPYTDLLPADTLVYGTIRTDDAYLESLDRTFASLGIGDLLAFFGEGIPLTFTQTLDVLVAEFLGGTYDITINSWLGDHAAFALTDFRSTEDFDLVLYFDIDNRQALDAILLPLFDDTWTQEERGDFTYTTDGGAYFAVSDGLMAVATSEDLLPFNDAPNVPLASNVGLVDATELLPEDDYPIFVYAATGQFTRRVFDIMGMELDGTPNFGRLLPVGPTALGAAIVGDRSFTVDLGMKLNGVRERRSQTNLPLWNSTAVKQDFLANVPQDSGLVIHGANLTDTFLFLVGLLRSALGPDSTEVQDILLQIDQLRLFQIKGKAEVW